MANQEEIIAKAQAAARSALQALPAHLNTSVRDYTRRAAETILDSADEAVGNIYPNENLQTLKTYADDLDKQLRDLARIIEETGEQTKSLNSFSILYRMWSPRDDARKAVIDLIVTRFGERLLEFQWRGQGWINTSLNDVPLPTDIIRTICSDYLQSTKQQQGLATPIALEGIGFVRKEVAGREMADFLLGVEIVGKMQMGGWCNQLSNDLQKFRLFSDEDNFLAIDYDYFHLEGLATKFSETMAGSFETRLRSLLRQEVIFSELPKDEVTLSFTLRNWHPLIKRRIFGVASIIASAIGGECYLVLIHNKHLILDIFSAVITAVVSFCIIAGCATGREFIKKRRQQATEILDRMTAQVEDKILTDVNIAWRETVSSLSAGWAARIIGRLTLVKKRPLDFAMEGEWEMVDR